VAEIAVVEVGARVALPGPAALRATGSAQHVVLADALEAITQFLGAPVELSAVAWSDAAAPPPSEVVLAEWRSGTEGAPDIWTWDVCDASARSSAAARIHVRTAPGLVRESAMGVRTDRRPMELDPALRIGARHTLIRRIGLEDTTDHVRGRRPVLATPVMLGFMEQSAQALLDPHLLPDHATVGAHLDVAHLRPAFLGEDVEVTAVLIGMNRRRAAHHVVATVGARVVGAGRHENHIVGHGRLDRDAG
jgi:predicted thioesterase